MSFRSDLRNKIQWIKIDDNNVSIYYYSIKKMEEEYPKILAKCKKYITTNNCIVHWHDIDKGLVDVYNVHFDCIELAVKLKYESLHCRYKVIS